MHERLNSLELAEVSTEAVTDVGPGSIKNKRRAIQQVCAIVV